MCSVFIYNSRGALDEESITNLSLVVQLTKHIRITAKQNSQVLDDEEDDDSEEFSKFFPYFLWVLRDFSLKLETEDG